MYSNPTTNILWWSSIGSRTFLWENVFWCQTIQEFFTFATMHFPFSHGSNLFYCVNRRNAILSWSIEITMEDGGCKSHNLQFYVTSTLSLGKTGKIYPLIKFKRGNRTRKPLQVEWSGSKGKIILFSKQNIFPSFEHWTCEILFACCLCWLVMVCLCSVFTSV